MRSYVLIESEVEQVAIDILKEIGCKTIYGPDIAPDGEKPERQSYSDVVLVDRLRDAIERLNPKIPQEAREEAVKKVLRNESPNTIVNNQHFHKMLVEGVDVEYRHDGRIKGDKVWLFDFDNPNNNEFLVLNQFTVKENNCSAVKVLGDDTLRDIARELVNTVRSNVTIDWTLRESVQAKLRVMVKRILRKYGYPPDKQKKATEIVLEQASLICKDWAEQK